MGGGAEILKHLRKKQCCGFKYIEFGSRSRILAQFGPGYVIKFERKYQK